MKNQTDTDESKVALILMVLFLMLIGSILYKPIYNSRMKIRIERVKASATEQFMERDSADMEESFRNYTGLSDVWCDFNISSWYGYDPDYISMNFNKEKNVLYLKSIPTIYSNEIDQYYTEEYDSQNASKLYAKMRSLQVNFRRKDFEYETPYGKAILSVFHEGADDRVRINSTSGHEYEIRDVKKPPVRYLRIDGETMYSWRPSPSTRVEENYSSSGSSGRTSWSSSGKSKPSRQREIDPDNYDIDAYYDDNRDLYEDYEEAWEGFLDDEEAWDDY